MLILKANCRLSHVIRSDLDESALVRSICIGDDEEGWKRTPIIITKEQPGWDGLIG